LDISADGRLLYRGRIVRTMIRMYPWELMFRDSGARHLQDCGCIFLSLPWTSLLSNKALLPAFWDRNPGIRSCYAPAQRPREWRLMRKSLSMGEVEKMSAL